MKQAYKYPYNYAPARTFGRNNNITQPTIHIKRTQTKKQVSLFHRILSLTILFSIGLFVLPYSYNKVIKPVYKTFISDKTGSTIDYNDYYDKFSNIFYNANISGKRVFIESPRKHLMQTIPETSEMTNLKKELQVLASSYPTITSSVYVWDYKTSKFVNINAEEPFSAASIIKIPVLLELFKNIERGEISLKDKFILKDIFRASGSGDLQFKAENSTYTIDELARRMMRDSDNSATNILMYLTGGSTNINRALREWGMKTTKTANWLPDLEGDNKTSAHEMATLLFNVDNPNFLSLNSREYVIDYLSDIRNNRLIQAGLPKDALFIHKTGDIGKMLGDAGIVYTPNGDRYIVVILVNRPYNAIAGKDFIVNASRIIYKSITTNKN